MDRGHPLAQDTTIDLVLDSDVDASYVTNRAELSIVERMKWWRQDAIWQHFCIRDGGGLGRQDLQLDK